LVVQATEFYFIKNGRVSLCVRLPGQEIPLGNLGEGSFFGESSLLTGQSQQAEVKSESISELAYLTKDDFMAIIDKFPTFFLAVRRISDNRMQTANNVQRMTKMQRRQSNPHVPVMQRKPKIKRVAETVLQSRRLHASFATAGQLFTESRRSIAGAAPLVRIGSQVERQSARLSQRFSSSRRISASGMFSASYIERISLGQARHLSTLRSLDGLQIENSPDDPLWN
jgi:CRP-like cAMP-binding protein